MTLPATRKRIGHVHLRVNDLEMQRMRRLARRRELPVSDMLRALVREETERVKRADEELGGGV